MPTTIAAVAFCGLLLGLAILQIALAFGAPLGRFAWGGAHTRLPIGLRIGSAVSIVMYAIFSAIVLARAGLLTAIANPSIARIGIWVLVGYLGLGVVMNGISRSKAERFTMTPLALALCMMACIVALGDAPA
jgi:hypothetical protein